MFMNTKTATTKSQPNASRIPNNQVTITRTLRVKAAGKQATPPATSQLPAPKRQKTQSSAKAQPVPAAPGVSKQSRIIARLQTAPGASIAQLVELTGWQPHSIRGVISGILRKKLGFEVKSEPSPKTGERLYRILGPAAA